MYVCTYARMCVCVCMYACRSRIQVHVLCMYVYVIRAMIYDMSVYIVRACDVHGVFFCVMLCNSARE
jgi:hypothetical protein